MRHWSRIDTGTRNPADDLLAAFIMSGWEMLMPLQEAMETADYLAWQDPQKAQRLGALIARGEPMPADMSEWFKSVRADAVCDGEK